MPPKSVEELTQMMARLEADYRALLLVTSALSDLILNSPRHADSLPAPLMCQNSAKTDRVF